MPIILSNPTAEQELNSAILFDPSALSVVKETVAPDDYTELDQRQIATALWRLHTDEQVITPASVLAALNKDDSSLRIKLQHLYDQASDEIIAAAPQNAARVRLLAIARTAIASAEQFTARTTSAPDEITSLTALHIDNLTRCITGQRERDSSAGAIVASDTNNESAIGFPFGLAWLDDPDMIGGFGETEKLLIQGIYGGRKTALAVFLTSQMMRKRPNHKQNAVSYFFLDDTREVLKNWYIAQLATSYMRHQGVPVAEWTLKARGTHQSLRSAVQQAALVWATERFTKLPLDIYDGSDNIAEYEVMQAKMQRDVARGKNIFVIDYVQDVKVKSTRTIYERMEFLSQEWKRFCTRYKVNMVWVSQRNEGANALNGGSENAGTKGGGDLPAAANYILENTVSKDHPDKLMISLKKSRWSARGSMTYTINPANGLILDPQMVPIQSAPTF